MYTIVLGITDNGADNNCIAKTNVSSIHTIIVSESIVVKIDINNIVLDMEELDTVSFNSSEPTAIQNASNIDSVLYRQETHLVSHYKNSIINIRQ